MIEENIIDIIKFYLTVKDFVIFLHRPIYVFEKINLICFRPTIHKNLLLRIQLPHQITSDIKVVKNMTGYFIFFDKFYPGTSTGRYRKTKGHTGLLNFIVATAS